MESSLDEINGRRVIKKSTNEQHLKVTEPGFTVVGGIQRERP